MDSPAFVGGRYAPPSSTNPKQRYKGKNGSMSMTLDTSPLTEAYVGGFRLVTEESEEPCDWDWIVARFLLGVAENDCSNPATAPSRGIVTKTLRGGHEDAQRPLLSLEHCTGPNTRL
jgi:hypothetical protein